MAIRKDRWTPREDRQLSQIILTYIKEGRPQNEAFEQVAVSLKRTAAACGFRWNSTIRKQYVEEIRDAKSTRRVKKPVVVIHNLTDDQIMNLAILKKIQFSDLQNHIINLKEQIQEKECEIELLKQRLKENELRPNDITINEDSQMFLQILERAKQRGALNQPDLLGIFTGRE